MNLICALLGHRRAERTHYDGSVWRGLCRRCGRAMIARVPGAWTLDSEEGDQRDGE